MRPITLKNNSNYLKVNIWKQAYPMSRKHLLRQTNIVAGTDAPD